MGEIGHEAMTASLPFSTSVSSNVATYPTVIKHIYRICSGFHIYAVLEGHVEAIQKLLRVYSINIEDM